jgi:hypothetical protein
MRPPDHRFDVLTGIRAPIQALRRFVQASDSFPIIRTAPKAKGPKSSPKAAHHPIERLRLSAAIAVRTANPIHIKTMSVSFLGCESGRSRAGDLCKRFELDVFKVGLDACIFDCEADGLSLCILIVYIVDRYSRAHSSAASICSGVGCGAGRAGVTAQASWGRAALNRAHNSASLCRSIRRAL